MRRLLAWITALSLVCAPQIALSQILLPILTGSFPAGGITYGTISLAANGWHFCYSNNSSVSSLTVALGATGGTTAPCTTTGGANPGAGHLVVVTVFTTGTFSTITDTIGDTGGTSWTQCSTTQTSNSMHRLLYYRQIGTTPASNQITVTTTANAAIEVIYGEAQTTSGSFGLDGTPVNAGPTTSTNPDPGSITTSSTSSWVIGYYDAGSGTATAGTGYTQRVNGFWSNPDGLEDRITTSAGSYDPNWTSTSQTWGASGCAFQAH